MPASVLIDTGVVDSDRVGIIGGSYGGYMVVAALAFEPDVFSVGVDIFGVTNWLRTLENIPLVGRKKMRSMTKWVIPPLTENDWSEYPPCFMLRKL